jgi:hypothetical protein
MKDFDFYQVVGVIAPGTVVVIGGVFLFYPDQQQLLVSISGVSLGSLGVGLILAYVAGQLLQAVGNAVETVWWWLWGGMPTDWVRTGRHELVADPQVAQVHRSVRLMLDAQGLDVSSLNKSQWYSVIRQVYAAVSSGGRAARVDIFNGNYGLCRGIAAGFLVLLAWAVFVDWRAWKIELVLVIVVAIAIYRMHRFGVHYGRELVVQFLQLSTPASQRGVK